MDKLLEVKQLIKSFNGKNAVDGVSFDVEKGTCFGLLGPNGAGKTTTIEMLEGILTPTSGEILYQSSPMSKAVYQTLGIQFQHTALQDYLTVNETLKMFAAFYPNPIAHDELIALCQLEAFVDTDHRKLSGGQKQRLLLALALINQPQLIFLDEPTTGLDPYSRRLFWQLIERIKGQGKTVILTTHYMDEAEFLCDTIAIMDKGKIIAKDSPQTLLAKHFSHSLIKLPKAALANVQHCSFEFEIQNSTAMINTQSVENTLSELISMGVSLDGLQIKSANLDDLFLKLSGNQLG